MAMAENIPAGAERPRPGPTAGERPPLRALVAYGPTQEPIDEVRFIGNRSSGRMGAAIAGALVRAGCEVTACRGPGTPGAPGASERRFRTAADLLGLLSAEWPAHDLLVMAAAVADYRPARAVTGKIRRAGPLTMDLEPTEDILAALAGRRRAGQYVVGFALELPEELAASASEKLARKRADAIVANPLETMDSEHVRATVFLAGGPPVSPGARLTKAEFAEWLAGTLVPLAEARRRTGG